MRKKNDKGKDRHMSCLRTFREEVYAENLHSPLFSKRDHTSLWQTEVKGFFNHCMLLIVQYLKTYLISFGSVIAQLDWSPRATRPHSGGLAEESRGEAIQKKELDYPVKSDADLREESLRPDNDKHRNRVSYQLNG